MQDGCLKLRVLRRLKEGKMSGYDIMTKIEEYTGKKPSPGSIYPLLSGLLKENLVSAKSIGRKKIYSITKKGSTKIDKLVKEKEQFFSQGLKLISSLHPMPKREQKRLVDAIGTSKEDLFENLEMWHELKTVLIKLSLSKDFQKKRKKVVEIMQKTVKSLKRL